MSCPVFLATTFYTYFVRLIAIFLTDNLVFRFNRINVDYEFPKLITDVFPGGPTSVDAAVTFSKNRKKVMPGSTYLVKVKTNILKSLPKTLLTVKTILFFYFDRSVLLEGLRILYNSIDCLKYFKETNVQCGTIYLTSNWKSLQLNLSLIVNNLDYQRCPWCNGYRRRNWTRRHEFKS